MSLHMEFFFFEGIPNAIIESIINKNPFFVACIHTKIQENEDLTSTYSISMNNQNLKIEILVSLKFYSMEGSSLFERRSFP